MVSLTPLTPCCHRAGVRRVEKLLNKAGVGVWRKHSQRYRTQLDLAPGSPGLQGGWNSRVLGLLGIQVMLEAAVELRTEYPPPLPGLELAWGQGGKEGSLASPRELVIGGVRLELGGSHHW